MGQFSFVHFSGFCSFWPFLGIFCILGVSGGVGGVLGVLLSYKVTRGIILVVGRVTEMVFGNLEGQRGVNGGQRWPA